MNNYFNHYVHITEVCGNQDRIWQFSAKSKKLYGKTCQQGVIQSGLRKCFNSNLEGPSKVLRSENRTSSLCFRTTKGKASGSAELSYLEYIPVILNDNWPSVNLWWQGAAANPRPYVTISPPTKLTDTLLYGTFQVQWAGVENTVFLQYWRSVVNLNKWIQICLLSSICNQLIPYLLWFACKMELVSPLPRVWNCGVLLPDLEQRLHMPSIFTDNI